MNVRVPFWRTRETWVALLVTSACFAGVAALAHRTWPLAFSMRAAPFVPHLAYLPDGESRAGLAAWDQDPRALGSPVLFALPTAAGFSPTRSARVFPASPALQERRNAGLWLDRMPADAPAPELLRDRTAAELEGALSARWGRLPQVKDPFAPPVVTSAVVVLEWPDGRPELASGLPLAIDPALDEKVWEVHARLFFSDRGDVRSVFVEQSTATRERTDSLVRALYRLHTGPGAESSVRVGLYLQRPTLDSARASEATP